MGLPWHNSSANTEVLAVPEWLFPGLRQNDGFRGLRRDFDA